MRVRGLERAASRLDVAMMCHRMGESEVEVSGQRCALSEPRRRDLGLDRVRGGA